MFWKKKISEAFEKAYKIKFDDKSKFILFSDVHRGMNDWSDDFAHNQNLFFFAMRDYFEKGFTYIEVGDGDELWENKHFSNIRYAHSHIFWLLREYYLKDRFYLIYGNHDIERRNTETVKRTLWEHRDDRTGEIKDLFKSMTVYESIVLEHTKNKGKLFLLHGHQADWVSGVIWRFSRFMVRHFWKRLQLLGIKDPTSPAKNFKRAEKVDRKLLEWAQENKQILIAGHTHRSRLAENTIEPYFNTGSCVHPRCITGLEIEKGKITLVKWWFGIDEKGECGCLQVKREVLAGPKNLSEFTSLR
jgi:UDP-2,3-diacylglucosamine pyrophosphatase LpxH